MFLFLLPNREGNEGQDHWIGSRPLKKLLSGHWGGAQRFVVDHPFSEHGQLLIRRFFFF